MLWEGGGVYVLGEWFIEKKKMFFSLICTIAHKTVVVVFALSYIPIPEQGGRRKKEVKEEEKYLKNEDYEWILLEHVNLAVYCLIECQSLRILWLRGMFVMFLCFMF